MVDATYVPLAFSDHLGFIITYYLPEIIKHKTSPNAKPIFKVSPEVIKCPVYKMKLKEKMIEWKVVLENCADELSWWEHLVKPGIRKLGMERDHEIRKESCFKFTTISKLIF